MVGLGMPSWRWPATDGRQHPPRFHRGDHCQRLNPGLGRLDPTGRVALGLQRQRRHGDQQLGRRVGPDDESSGGTTTFSGTIQDGAGGVGLGLSGSGTLVLAGGNTYSGNTTLSSGTLQLGNRLAVQNSTVNVTPGGTLGFSKGVTTPILGDLAGSGNVVLATVAAEPVRSPWAVTDADTSYGEV